MSKLAKLQGLAPQMRVEQGQVEQQQLAAERVPAQAEQPGAPAEQQALAPPRAQLPLESDPGHSRVAEERAAWQRAERQSPEAQQVAAERQQRAAQLVSEQELGELQARQRWAEAQASTLARTWLLLRPLQPQPHRGSACAPVPHARYRANSNVSSCP